MGSYRSCTFIVFQILLFTLSLTSTKAFNLDVTWPLVFSGDENSLFGFAIALHQDRNQHMLLVGAPHSNASDYGDVDREGALYKCIIDNLTSTRPCELVQLDSQRDQPFEGEGRQVGSKSHSLLGATVRSGGRDGPVLVCAPSFVWFRANGKTGQRAPVGRCFIAYNNFQRTEKYEPCLSSSGSVPQAYNKLDQCQAGIGGDISEQHFLIGAPGSFFWQGAIFRQDVNGQQSRQFTPEGSFDLDNSYRGYTVLLADLNSDGELENVVGTPRGSNMFGLVSVFNHNNLELTYEVSGNQLGEFFGNSLAVTDLNGDGKNDLIVGAPMYTELEQRTTNFEIGRIYIFYQSSSVNNEAQFSNRRTIVGRNGRSRFGFSLTALGDINGDGFNDLAVGAPYDGDGAVYIFSGGPMAIVSTPAQVVRPSDLGVGRLQGFGFSLSGERDIDGNTYPDLAIGSHTSSSAVVLRSRPVITIDSSITFNVEHIDLEDSNFTLPNDERVPGFTITTCIRYTGEGVASRLPFALNLLLDAVKPVTSRAFIYKDNQSHRKISRNVNLSKDSQNCNTFDAYVQQVIRDKFSPVVFRFDYSLDEDRYFLQPGELLPVLDSRNAFVTEQLALVANCSNEGCLPDLRVNINHDLDRVVVGKREALFVDVTYQNNGDEAFEGKLFTRIPRGVTYIGIDRKNSDLLIECDDTSHRSGDSDVVCDVGNPVPAKFTVPFRLQFEVSLRDKETEHLHIHFHANSSNLDHNTTLADNTQNASIPIATVYNLTFSGYSNPEQVVLPANDTTPETISSEADIGTEVVHFYIFTNQGPSHIGRSLLKVLWPMNTMEDHYLLYLTKVTPSKGQCTVEGGVNPKDYELIEREVTNNTDTGERNRYAREANEAPPSPQPLMMVDCETGNCVEISCEFDQIGGNEATFILTIQSRLWLKTLLKSVPEDEIPSDWVITSHATLEVVNSAYTVADDLPLNNFMENVTTRAFPLIGDILYDPKPFPWWAYLLAALIGFAVLSCLIITAWKLGFFKRKKIGEDEKTLDQNDYLEETEEEQAGEK